jgi:hypothetical protein
MKYRKKTDTEKIPKNFTGFFRFFLNLVLEDKFFNFYIWKFGHAKTT